MIMHPVSYQNVTMWLPEWEQIATNSGTNIVLEGCENDTTMVQDGSQNSSVLLPEYAEMP